MKFSLSMMPNSIIMISGIVLLVIFFMGCFLQASAQEPSIPNWIKNTAKWWSQDQTSDTDFLQAIQYLIDNNILHTRVSNQYNQSNLAIHGKNWEFQTVNLL